MKLQLFFVNKVRIQKLTKLRQNNKKKNKKINFHRFGSKNASINSILLFLNLIFDIDVK